MKLENILKEVLNSIELNPKVEVKINYKTGSDSDYEIFIRKGFKIYSFRPYGNSELFYERWRSEYNSKLFTSEGLKEQLIILLRS